jgi:iron complex transport system substrate-binding protein
LFGTTDEHGKARRCGSSLIMNKRGILILVLLCTVHTAFAAEKAALPDRIISLSPATTEVLFSLGVSDRIVGVTSFCDHPEEARKKQKVGGMSNPSLEAIMALKPDLVVMTTDGNPREVDDRLRSMGLRTYVWNERMLAELPNGVRKLAAALGVSERGGKLAADIEKTLNASRSRIHSLKHMKVLYIVWPEPLLVAGPGTAIDDAIVLLGMENAAHKAATSYPRYSIEELIREAPEVIFIGKGSGMDMRSVSQGILKKLATVPAVKNNRICYVSDSLYRLGPRVVQGIEELAACIQ